MEKEITIKIEGKEWEESLDKAFERANKKVKIDGFRPGKAPKDVFIKKYGKESLYMDAADLSLELAYAKMLEENASLELVAQPEVSIKSIDENGLELLFVVTTRPEVKLGKYTKLGVKKEDVKVTDEEISKTIDQMRERYAENVLKEGAVANGDIAIIDFEGFKDGVAFEGGKGENYSLKIGSNTFIPGFEEQLIGMKSGEEKEIEVTFPKEYHSEELKGQKATFKVKVHEVKEVVIPELGEDFYADLGMEGVNNEEELRKQVEETIRARKEMDSENKYIDDLLETAAKNTTIDIPEVMIKDEIDRMMKQYTQNLQMQGLSLEQFYQFTNSDEQALRDQMREEAVRRVTYRLMLEEIVKVEKLEVTDEAAKEEAKNLAEKYNMKEDDFLTQFGGLEMVKYDLSMRNAIDTLKK